MSLSAKELREAILSRGGSLAGCNDKDDLAARLASLVIQAEKKPQLSSSTETRSSSSSTVSASAFNGEVGIFWDIENLSIPKTADASKVAHKVLYPSSA